MKTMYKKLFSLLLVAVLLVSAIPFEASANTFHTVTFLDWDWDVIDIVSTVHGNGAREPVVGTYKDGIQVFSHWQVLTRDSAGNYSETAQTVTARPSTGDPGLYIFNVTSDMYLRAMYKMPEYTITFNAAGGTVSPASKKVARDAVIGELPVPQRAGYNFAGWKNEATGTWYDATMAMPSGDMTLTAQWAAGTNKVTFMEYDADASKAQGKVVYMPWRERAVTYQEAYSKYNEVFDYNDSAQRPGYKIVGWMYENGATFNPDAPVVAETKVYPKYEARTYTVTFQENWTYGTTVKKTVTYGQNINTFYYEPKASIDNSHFAFMGWYSSAGVKLDPTKTYNFDYDTEWFAAWDEAVNVQLWIYDKDNLDAPYTIIRNYYASTKTPTDLSKLKVSDFCSKAQEGTFSGWFTSYENMVSHAKGYGQQPLNSRTAYAGMVLHGYADITTTSNNNTNTGSGSNSTGNNYNSTSKQDPTNPATGDTAMIEVSVMVMTLAAAALVVMMQLRKRKMI